MNITTRSGLETRSNARNLSPLTIREIKGCVILAVSAKKDERREKEDRDKEPVNSLMWHYHDKMRLRSHGVALGYILAAQHIAFISKL